MTIVRILLLPANVAAALESATAEVEDSYMWSFPLVKGTTTKETQEKEATAKFPIPSTWATILMKRERVLLRGRDIPCVNRLEFLYYYPWLRPRLWWKRQHRHRQGVCQNTNIIKLVVDKPPVRAPGYNSTSTPLDEELTQHWSKTMSLAEKQSWRTPIVV